MRNSVTASYLSKVPGQHAVNEHVGHHERADLVDADAVIGIQEGTRADLQDDMGKQHKRCMFQYY